MVDSLLRDRNFLNSNFQFLYLSRKILLRFEILSVNSLMLKLDSLDILLCAHYSESSKIILHLSTTFQTIDLKF